jgi:hypothetical protein
MPFAIGRLALAAALALSALPAHARGAGAAFAPSFRAGPGMARGAAVPFGHSVAPRSAVIVAPRQHVVVAAGRARNVIVAPRQRVVVSPEQHAMMARGHRVFVVPETVLVVPQTPVYYVAAPYASCVWCDDLGCVRQTLDFCAMFAGS